MSPSQDHLDETTKRVVKNISRALTKNGYEYVEGTHLEGVGDFSCAICSSIQECTWGIAIVGLDTLLTTAGNIWWESGFMNGLGRPVIAVVHNAADLPSDFVRTFSVFFEKRGYTRKLLNMLRKARSRTEYFMKVGDTALQSGNFPEAISLFREEYLNNKTPLAIDRLREAEGLVKKSRLRAGLKTVLLEDLDRFLKKHGS